MSIVKIKKETLIHNIKIAIIIIAIFESEGLFSSIAGIDSQVSAWIFSAFMSLFAMLSLTLRVTSPKRESIVFFFPIIAFICAFIVSAVSALVIFPKPASNWIPSHYQFTFLFSFYFLYILNTTARELSTALVYTAIIVIILLALDQILSFEFLDSYRRASTFSSENRRIVILKNETTLGLLILLAHSIFTKQPSAKGHTLTALSCFLLIISIFLMESRLATAAIIVSCLVMTFYNKQNRRLYSYALLASIFAAATSPMWIDAVARAINIATDPDSNISIRSETIAYMFNLYKESNGWGTGMMSPTGTINNILFSDPSINYVDGGVFSSIFQFGIFGLAIWIGYTIILIKIFRYNLNFGITDRHIALACLAFLVGFTTNPLPLNFFLQPWTTFIGGLLIYFAWQFKRYRSIYSHPTQ